MKLVFLLLIISMVGITVYFFSSQKLNHKKQKKLSYTPLLIATTVVLISLVFVGIGMYKSETAADIWCGKTHEVRTKAPAILKSSADYFEQGNYEYDTGNCNKAIASYTKSIELDSTNPQSFNNRAYAYMRLRDYDQALTDLNKALSLRPNYIEALMNRGDIHNYYYKIDRKSAIQDYKKAMSLGATQKETSVCGHLFLAQHNGWTLGTFIDLPHQLINTCY